MVLFAKSPVPGRVKTRLAAVVGDDAAARLHTAFVWDTLDKLREFNDFADVELHTDTPTDAWEDAAVARQVQAPGGLQLKLLHAIEQGLAAARPQVIILGSDSPTLPRGHLHRLIQSQADVVLGPCEDGGYYAIGCRRAHPGMFAGVQWSTRNVLEETERAARGCGLMVEKGDPWYDVDGPDDLARLAEEQDLPPHTREALRAAGIGRAV